ncbi:MAG: hydrogenase subunit MbhD domain-containing protein [Methanobacteriota archaeon]
MIEQVLLISLVIFSILVVVEKQLLRSVVFLASSTVLLVVLLFLLQAPDVAITMAVVGTGATTILYLTVIKKVGGLK